MTMVLLVGLAALPAKPLQTFGLGGAIIAMFVTTMLVARGASSLAGWGAFPIVLALVMLFMLESEPGRGTTARLSLPLVA